LDEPSSGLDVQSKLLLWDFIKSQKLLGKTFVIATHNMDEVESLCDRVAVIDEGKVLEINTPKKLIEKYIKKCKNNGNNKIIRNLEDVFIHITGKGLRD
jgi:ABC-2 type transport system ATP-binding protein